MSRKKMLFVTYGGGHVNMIVPVAQRLLAEGRHEVSVLGLTTAARVLRETGIPYFGYKDLLSIDDVRARRHGERLSGQLEANASIDPEETISYLGLCYADLENEIGVEAAAERYSKLGRQCFLPVGVLIRLLGHLKPDLVVTTNSPRSEQAAILAAKALGIPALCLVDLFAMQEIRWIGQPGYADRICVLNDFVRQCFIQAGRLPHEITITGNPAFDRLAQPSLLAQAAKLRTQLGTGSRALILWASQPEPAINPFNNLLGDPGLPRKIDQALFGILPRHPDWQLAIRPHPSEPIDTRDWPTGVVLSTTPYPLPVWLAAADVVLLSSSTVGMEAAMLGKPLVQIGLSVFSKDAPYDQMGLANPANDLAAIEPALQAAIDRTWQPNADIPPVGTAAQRVHEIIHSLLEPQ